MMTTADLYQWTKPRIEAECHRAWLDYDGALGDRYTRYFQEHPEFANTEQVWSAKDIESALPPGYGGLAERLPSGRHSQHLSGKSSQILALALLGASAKSDPSHQWLWNAFSPIKPGASQLPRATFEVEVATGVLGEQSGRRTSVDYLIEDPEVVICIECKWREDGIGSCSCADHEGCEPATGACRNVIRDGRPIYWETARDVFFLPERRDGSPCPLSPVYQAVRNMAAALRLSEPDGVGVFGLIYDANNPYFAGCGDWPGWPTVLSAALRDDAHTRARFRAVSWQELMPLLELDDGVRNWARDKHGLE